MSKLLWPERRRGLASEKVTTADSRFLDLFPLLNLLGVPKGTPINLLTNLHPKEMAYADGVLGGQPKTEFGRLQGINRAKGHAALLKRLLEVNTCPDFNEDKGLRNMSDKDKRALIEYIKYF